MHNIELILTLTIALSVALALGFLALRVKLPPIVGYLLGGLLIGPYTPGFVANHALAEQLAEVGVILLMFGVGLHFQVKDLLAVRTIAVTGALFQITLATALGTLVAHAFGWTWTAGLVFGLALSVASTVVLMRVLADNRDLHSRTGRIAIGWLVVEDIFTVFVVVVLPAAFGPTSGSGGGGLALSMGLAALKLAALTALTLGPGARLIPKLLTAVARTRSRELFTLTVLVVALGLALGSAVIFGVSMALGAFLAGMVVGQSEFSARAASEALPMRDAFAVLFFVSIGMLFDPMHLVRAPLLTAATVAIVVVGKPIGALLLVLLLGHGARIGLRVSVALAQVGEFSFILAMLADQLKLLPAGATDSLVAASIVSITINPLLYRGVRRMEHALGKSRFHHILEPRASTALSGPTPEVRLPDSGPRAVVVGYGPVGETVTRLLAAHGVAPTVIELNIDTVRRLQSEGMHALYGDANQRDVLKQAGLADALALILSVPGSDDSAELIRLARELNPKLHVVVRSTFHSQARALCSAGADEAFSGEAEVAMAMIDAILTREGATPEEMDLERKRARTELYRVGEPG